MNPVVDLDCLTSDELSAIAADPSQLQEIRNYACLLQQARDHRLAGEIEKAWAVERHLTAIYVNLPETLQW